MATVGKYCKAYLVQELCQFLNWDTQVDYLKKESQYIDGKEVQYERKLTDEDVVYLQENYVVTDGIFFDDHIVYNNITPEWQAFCKTVLQFDVSTDEPVKVSISAI
ncbi:hypothetical protein H6G97_31330 [Nostoc flagelliforme FACHB-838]|uniref:Uncharacterized protein n=1 Tax=Nostoc flagelliforme FACHB-838 TaxID=2692904 RepID=A0ABR8DWK0_9NOSO|nr:hypothetical protein [Nostoc flagelliforme]MBD2533806.1 hypothetical protein [Nostoc flagelliforme FACHB-838]